MLIQYNFSTLLHLSVQPQILINVKMIILIIEKESINYYLILRNNLFKSVIRKTLSKTASFMIRFASHDLECAINLFNQYDAHHLVWKGHIAE